MGKLAFVYSGQGAQYTGMGSKLAEVSTAASKIFTMADKLRPGTSKQCFEGSAQELSQTGNTQPCMFTVEMAATAALFENEISPDFLAGFSLGEIAALTVSGAVSFDTGFQMVCCRGEFMQEAAKTYDSAMAAVLKLDNKTIEELCREYKNVYPVNYNCPGQVTVAGLKSELEMFKKDVKTAGGRIVPLQVAGGFHSPFMEDASKNFGDFLESLQIGEAFIPLYSNYTASPYTGNYRELLRKQICNPVRWQEIIENMIKEGADTFIEIGPGKTLRGLIGKISADVRTYNVEDDVSLRETVLGVSEEC
jgi:[acyl-carrier-protein] S-malonyltransferase